MFVFLLLCHVSSTLQISFDESLSLQSISGNLKLDTGKLFSLLRTLRFEVDATFILSSVCLSKSFMKYTSNIGFSSKVSAVLCIYLNYTRNSIYRHVMRTDLEVTEAIIQFLVLVLWAMGKREIQGRMEDMSGKLYIV